MACREEKDDTGLHFAETLEFTEDCSGLVSDYVDPSVIWCWQILAWPVCGR